MLKSKTLVAILLAGAVALSFTGAPARADFSGKWKLNVGKSDVDENYKGSKTKDITQTPDFMIIKTSSVQDNPNNPYIESDTLYFDGKAHTQETTFKDGYLKKTLVATWAPGEEELDVKRDDNIMFLGSPIKTNFSVNYKLSDEGKTLTVILVHFSDRGEQEYIEVFDKQ